MSFGNDPGAAAAAQKADEERSAQLADYATHDDQYFLDQFKPSYTKTLNTDGGPGEAARYNEAGFTDPWLAREWYQYSHNMGGLPSWLQKDWDTNNPTLDPVGTLGQRIARRGDMPDFTSSEEALKGALGSLGYGDTGYLAYVPGMLGISADPSMASWMGNNTAAAQAARDNDGGLFGDAGGLMQLAALAAAAYTGGASLMAEAPMEAGALTMGDLALSGGEMMIPEVGGYVGASPLTTSLSQAWNTMSNAFDNPLSKALNAGSKAMKGVSTLDSWMNRPDQSLMENSKKNAEERVAALLGQQNSGGLGRYSAALSPGAIRMSS